MPSEDTSQTPVTSAKPASTDTQPESRPFGIAQGTLFVAVVSAAGYVGTAYLQASGMLDVERERQRTQLVLQAVDVPKQEDRRANLKFLLDTGLLRDPDGKLTKAVRDEKAEIPRVPRLPAKGIEWVDIEEHQIPHERSIAPGATQPK